MIHLAEHEAHRGAMAYLASAGLATGIALSLALAPPVRASELPVGFRESVAVSGLDRPTVVRPAPDGRVFVAEQDGRILVLDHLGDPPRVFADLRGAVDSRWDRGLMGLALDPAFPAAPWVYVLYSRPPPPGSTVGGARLSRLEDDGSGHAVREQVLLDGGWCESSLSHAAGALNFAADGSLYVAAGDGAGWEAPDYGPDGDPCGDPPREGGALRSQDALTPGDPLGFDGAVLRVDPATGAGVGAGDPNRARIAAYGFRNPFRTAVRPGTDELWIGDAGWNGWEEVDRLVPVGDPANFGWPCYEGAGREPEYDALDLGLCEGLYARGPDAVAAPVWAYAHGRPAVPGDGCAPAGASVVSGLAFAPEGGPWPEPYGGGLFVADFSRGCIWALPRGPGGSPSAAAVRPFMAGAAGPVDLAFGRDGDLLYAAFAQGEIRRVHFGAGNRAPSSVISATPTTGPAPLTVHLDGSGSLDPDADDPIRFAWDLDGDGAYDDGSGPTAVRRYRTGTSTVGLRVTDSYGHAATASVLVRALDTPPAAVIAHPRPGIRWRMGERIAFRGRAADAQDGRLPDRALSWTAVLHPCAKACPGRPLHAWTGTGAGAFVVRAGRPASWLELRLTARDSAGLATTRSVRLEPRTVRMVVASHPAGLRVAVDGHVGRAPLVRTVVRGSPHTIRALAQRRHGRRYEFRRWSDRGARAHRVVAARGETYVAAYRRAGAKRPRHARRGRHPRAAAHR
jgi:glucose/arabinose dehydrogenase